MLHSSGMDAINENVIKAISFGALVVAVMIHEVSHALVALACGDPTARDAGRISLNPIRHIDPIGTVVLPLILAFSGSGVMFGWAKPVPVNVMRCRNPRQAFWMTAIAGPISNLLQALLAVGLFYVLMLLAEGGASGPWVSYGIIGCLLFAIVNIVLMTFNLIPIPPLDGSRVMAMLLPEQMAVPYMRLERLGFLIIIILLNLSVFDGLIVGMVRGFLKLTGMPAVF